MLAIFSLKPKLSPISMYLTYTKFVKLCPEAELVGGSSAEVH